MSLVVSSEASADAPLSDICLSLTHRSKARRGRRSVSVGLQDPREITVTDDCRTQQSFCGPTQISSPRLH